MTPEAQRIAIAEACGWIDIVFRGIHPPREKDIVGRHPSCNPPGSTGIWSGPLPDYLQNLNAMHEAEKMITDDQWPKYRDLLSDLAFKASPPGAKWFRPHCCTAAQRAEAFLKTLGLWKDK